VKARACVDEHADALAVQGRMKDEMAAEVGGDGEAPACRRARRRFRRARFGKAEPCGQSIARCSG
jgi:hypothetical protein